MVRERGYRRGAGALHVGWPLQQQQQPSELVGMPWLCALRGATSPSAAAGAAGRCTKEWGREGNEALG